MMKWWHSPLHQFGSPGWVHQQKPWVFHVPPKKRYERKDGHQRKGPKQSWQLRVGTVKRFSFADSTHKFAWQACISWEHPSWSYFLPPILRTSSPYGFLETCLFMLLNNFGFILWHEQKKTPTTITKCIPNIPSWPTLNLSKSCILAFEPTGPIFVRQIFVRILRACRMKVGLVGWLVGWLVGVDVFFFWCVPQREGKFGAAKRMMRFLFGGLAGSI